MSPQPNLLNFLSSTSRLPPDVNFIVSSATTSTPVSVPAHKCFLADVSTVFAKMFFVDGTAEKLEEGMEDVFVKNVGEETLRMFVEHIYGKELVVDDMTVTSKYEMFLLVDQYSITGELRERLLQDIYAHSLSKEDFQPIVKLVESCESHNEAKNALEMSITRYMKANLVSLDKLPSFMSEHSWLEGHTLAFALSLWKEAADGGGKNPHLVSTSASIQDREREEIVREFLIFAKFPVERVEEMVNNFFVARMEGKSQIGGKIEDV